MRRYFSNLMAKGRETLTPKINEKLSKSFESAFPERQEVVLKMNESIRTPQSSQSSSAQSHVQPGRSYKEELYASRRFDLNTSSNPNYAFRNLQSFLQDEKIPAKVREKRHFVRPGLVKHAVIYAGRRKKFNEIVKGTISKIVRIHESQK